MIDTSPNPPLCPVHGRPTKRAACSKCNSAYMRGYLSKMRRTRPTKAILERARTRARRQGLTYSLRLHDISLPEHCPVLGLPLVVGQARSPASPSLDRIDPSLGYLPGNVRVISDRANMLKGKRSLEEVVLLSRFARGGRRTEYQALAAYMEREALLVEVRRRAAMDSSASNPWKTVADFLERQFRRYHPPLPE